MIDFLCCGWRKRRKYEEFNQEKCLSSGTSSVSHLNLDGSKHEWKSDQRSRELTPISKDEGPSNNRARIFNYRELATATRNFHSDNFLGEGGFGSVYKGKLPGTNEVVAVKKLNPTGIQGEKEFLVEVLMLSLLRHPSLVNMIGYCAEGIQRILVLEYMPLGSLEDHLHDLPPDRKPLDWDTRMKIAAGAAKGVDYLHREANPAVIFRDLKPSNILLDEGFHPKLSDFGLAKFGPVGDSSHVSTRVMGTHGYCAPEYASTGKLTAKSDTFSFGVVLLELISGRKAYELTRLGGMTSLVDWALPYLHDRKYHSQLVDPRLKGQFPVSALRKAINVASMCLRAEASQRPTMHDVVLAMDFITTLKQNHARSVSADNLSSGAVVQKQTLKVPSQSVSREQAVAEAKMWGEQWREKRRQSADANSSWVTQAPREW